MFVREADLSYDLGPASARPYVDLAVLERALVDTGADAVWPGWGFVAEDPAFVDLCDKLGVTFIGPSADAMRQLGDKIGSKLIAEEVGVPVAPWSRGAVDTLEDALAAADDIGYPLMLKATAGGGGRGIRMVASAADLEDAYQRTSDEALRAFGNGTVFLERLVTGARHVEVQMIADSHGTAWALGVRDCSIQRRNQKVIEESASPLLSHAQTDELKAPAERLALAVGYVGAGTVEFLYHPGEQTFAFLEVNTRLQVEHSITEATTDIDLVKAQIHVAAGGRLEGEKPAEIGHAVEARLNAEDPDRDFAPAPGRIVHLDLPAGPGIRVDTGVAEGDTIPPDFDSMIAKIIAYGRTREEALARLRRAMSRDHRGDRGRRLQQELRARPAGPARGRRRHRRLGRHRLDRPGPRRGSAGRPRARRHRGRRRRPSRPTSTSCGSRPPGCSRPLTAAGRRPRTRRAGRSSSSSAARRTRSPPSTPARRRFRVSVASGDSEQTVDVERDRIDEFHRRLVVGGRRHHVVTATHGPSTLVEVDGVAHRVSRDEGGVLRSPAPALVVATPVAVGEEVEAGRRVLVLESMKMETVLHAPFAARVKELLVITGSQVETGAALIKLEPLGDGTEEAVVEQDGPALDLPGARRHPAGRGARRARPRRPDRGRPRLRRTAGGPGRRALRLPRRARRAPPDDVSVLADEMALLGTFADLAELSRNRPVDEEPQTELRVHSSREHFHTYLQSLDVERGGLPEQFRDRLLRVLRHYGVEDARPHARARAGGLPHLPGPAALDARGRARVRPARPLDRRAAADRRAGGPGA